MLCRKVKGANPARLSLSWGAVADHWKLESSQNLAVAQLWQGHPVMNFISLGCEDLQGAPDYLSGRLEGLFTNSKSACPMRSLLQRS